MRPSDFTDILTVGNKSYRYVSLKKLAERRKDFEKLPVSIRITIESVARNVGRGAVREDELKSILSWDAKDTGEYEIPLTVARVVMQDLTGVPAVVDLAAMRDTYKKLGRNPGDIEPRVPVELVIDHSVQIDYYGTEDALLKNSKIEFERNAERYRFLKWAQGAMKKLKIIPPSTGIIHQVNLEYLASVVQVEKLADMEWAFFDTLVGTDSHTTMINGLGVLGWGVGGIEAEAAMLGQPVTFLSPMVVGVNIHGETREGVTATDVVLTLTEILRKSNVVGKFVEFYGQGVTNLSLPDRATISNMCPEYGATCALFPVDDETIRYLKLTGRSEEQVNLVREYFQAQGLYGVQKGIEYSEIIDFDLSQVRSTIAGPKLPQQKVLLEKSRDSFLGFLESSGVKFQESKGSQVAVTVRSAPVKLAGKEYTIKDGDVVIAAITSCTNTSNPRVMIGAGLLAKKAVERGLKVEGKVKTSVAPGSRVVSQYLQNSGLQTFLDKLGFNIAGFGCTTCIGNSGPLNQDLENAITENNLFSVAVLSGNRNFEARIHRNVKANYLMSPPLVVAFAIAGTILIDMEKEPLGTDSEGKPVFLRDIWPSDKEIDSIISSTISRDLFESNYSKINGFSELWNKMESPGGIMYSWEKKSTYIRNPPFFKNFREQLPEYKPVITGARILSVFGDSVTTDHISPAGAISKASPAGKYLMEKKVDPLDFNSFGARRGNHEVMMRGTFGNNRIKNLLCTKEGPYAKESADGPENWLFDVSEHFSSKETPLVIFAGREYGTGSSRDWAAKGPQLLGVRAVIVESYERIHRSNLVGMGILPLQFMQGRKYADLQIDPYKPMNIFLPKVLEPQSEAKLVYIGKDGKEHDEILQVRIDTSVEVHYFLNGGILQYVMRNLAH
ncbi:MAG: aconitate hydratase AcnA [Cuniculiplasma sp.]